MWVTLTIYCIKRWISLHRGVGLYLSSSIIEVFIEALNFNCVMDQRDIYINIYLNNDFNYNWLLLVLRFLF